MRIKELFENKNTNEAIEELVKKLSHLTDAGLTTSEIRTILKFAFLIKENCTEFLKQIDYNVELWQIYRGIYANEAGLNAMANLHDRKSVDTPKETHNYFNKVFVEKFGYPFRNGVFVTSNLKMAKRYGTPGLTFPVGNFKFLWSPEVRDFYGELLTQTTIAKNKLWHEGNREINSAPMEKVIQYIDKSFIESYKTDNLKDAINSGHEIMLYVPHYYWINESMLFSHNGELFQVFQNIIQGKIQ